MEDSSHTGNSFLYFNTFYRDKPYSNLKPGQTDLQRDYYSKATMENPDGKVSLANFGRFDSIYNQNTSANVHKEDFKVPNKNSNTMLGYEFAHKPELYNYTKMGKTQGSLKNAGEQTLREGPVG